MHELYELKEKLCKELKEYGKKEKLDASSLQIVDTLAHALKNVCKVIESYEMEEEGYSNAYANSYGNSYGGGMSNRSMARGGSYNSYGMNSYARGRGSNARRDSMGRYSSRNDGGYSNDESFRMGMQELMQDAPNDYVRQKMMDAMNGM